MWRCTCLPRNVYDFLYPFKPLFRCTQARHFMLFCWLVVAIIRDPGVGTLKSALPYVPAGLSYWALLRMVRSGQWDAQAVLKGMSKKVLRALPPPADGRLYLIGDTTLKAKRGRKHPLGLVTRQSASSPYTFGFGMVVLIASWDGFRIPVAIAPIDPKRKGHQNILFRQMLNDFEPPAWVREIVVVADAGYAANATLKLINDLQWTYVFAMPRTRKFTNGNYVRDMVHHLPKIRYRRRATSKPDGRRQDYWVFMRRAKLHQLGDVTIVLSKKRRNFGPKRVKIIVTNLLDASAGTILSHYAWRWGVELTIKELKSGLHLGRMQVTNDVDRVSRSVVLPVCAYLVLLHLYSGKDGVKDASNQEGSLFRLKQRFTEDVMQDQVQRVEQKWRRKWKKIKEAA
jgi:Transposase DDE domain